MRRLSFLALITLAAPVGAQQAGVTELPDTLVQRVDRAFASLGGSQAPGCAIGISQNSRPVLTRAYGLANLEYGVPNTPETVFESGSVAKQFTAAAILVLVNDGKLSLDDDIRKHVAEVPDFGKTITIRHLLTHTSGLRDQWGLLGLKGLGAGTQVHTLETIVDLVAHQKDLNFTPGAEYLYSNTGYALAAVIVTRVSGMSFAKFSVDRLFKPLGMTNTLWRDDFTTVVKNRATAYRRDAATGAYHTDMPFTNVHGNGGLLTTVGDLLKWNAFLDDPSVIPGGAALVQAMQTQMTLNNGRKIAYALGVSVTNANGIREVSHGGSTAGYRTDLVRFPDARLSVAVICNTATANAAAYRNSVANVILRRPPAVVQAGPTSAVGPTLTEAQLKKYTGVFRTAATQQVVRVIVKDGKLQTTMPAALVLTPSGEDRFRVPGQGELAYTFERGKLQGVQLRGASDTVAYDAVAEPMLSALGAYAGSYWSPELETRVEIIVKDSALVIKQRPSDQVVLRANFADGFSGPGVGSVVFSRDVRGRVTGFGVWAGRIRNVRFVREGRIKGRTGPEGR